MSKFLIISIIFHISFIFIFKIKNFNAKNIDFKTINITYVEQKNSADEKKKEVKKKEVRKKTVEKKEVKKKVKKRQPLKQSEKAKKQKKLIKENEKNFDDMLKDLAEKDLDQKNNIAKKKIENRIAELSREKLSGENLTNENNKEIAAIVKILMQQINENWTRPPGIKGIENLVIKLIITLDPGGNVSSIKIPQKTDDQINNDKSLKPYLDSAIRAIKKSSPFEGLQKHGYNIWRKVTINFMPFETRE